MVCLGVLLVDLCVGGQVVCSEQYHRKLTTQKWFLLPF